MKSAALDTILAQYRRLLTPTGRTTLNRIIVLSGSRVFSKLSP